MKLFGPVLYYDLMRTARRGRYVAVRTVYAAALLLVLYLVYRNRNWLGYQRALTPQEMAQFAEEFFLTFMAVQFAAVFLLTPAYTAGAIAEEKERRSLDFLLATELLDREIILGKLAARLGNVLLLLLTGLPVLAFLQFLGGVDPNLVLIGYAALGATVLSLGSVSILFSIYLPRTLDAVFASYFYIVLYMVLSPCIPVVNMGNVFIMFAVLANARTGPTIWSSDVVTVCYLAFHGLLAVGCCLRAITQLRPATLTTRPRPHPTIERWQTGPPPRKHLPPIRDGDPLLWKEMHVEQGKALESMTTLPFFLTKRGSLHQLITLVSGCFIAVPIAMGIILIFIVLISMVAGEPQQSNEIVRLMSALIGGIMMLRVALSAAGRVSLEREKQTLDSLLSIPQDRQQIIWAKWLASVLCVRYFGWFLTPIWLVGVLTRGLSLDGLLLVTAALLVSLAFSASVGLYFSTRCTTGLRASLYTLLTLFAISVGPPMIKIYGMTPIEVVWHFAQTYGRYDEKLLPALVAFIVYAIAALALLWQSWRDLEAERGPPPRRAPQGALAEKRAPVPAQWE